MLWGFMAARSHQIIPVKDCLLGVKENEPILAAVMQWMSDYRIPAYDENTGKGVVRHILIRYGFTTKEIMVCLIINANKLLQKEALVEALRQIEGMTSISINSNLEKTNVILGKETQCIWGMPYITDYIHLRNTQDFSLTDTAIAYHISPQSFYQVNPVQTEVLYGKAMEFAAMTGKERVIDAYCGTGTMGSLLPEMPETSLVWS